MEPGIAARLGKMGNGEWKKPDLAKSDLAVTPQS
jgi:hypothetical protein